MRRTVGPFVIATVLSAVTLSACGGTPTGRGGADAVPGSRPNPAAGSASAGGTGVPGGKPTALIMAMPSSLGPVVTDDYMFTLYRSDKDAPSRSNCTDACAATWQPVIVGPKVQFIGGDQSLIGTVTRPDGARQLTLRSWPLYRYAGDKAEGNTSGQGIDGTWFAITPDGAKANASPAATGS